MSSREGQQPPGGLLLIELDGDGGHPAAWRKSRTAPPSVLGARRLKDTIHAAESAGFHAATFRDGPWGDGELIEGPLSGGVPANGAGRLNALQRAAFVAPLTRSIALVPEVDTVYTEPFHVATQLASLDYVSRGRAGWLVAAAGADGADGQGRAQAAAVGREPADSQRSTREAASSIEVGRRLWDSWEDGAVIRDVETGRYLDVDRLHYADFQGPDYSVKGPSIIPRPPQGQLPVLAPAGVLAPAAVACGAADALLVSAPTPELLAAELREVSSGLDAAVSKSRPEKHRKPALIAELDIVLDARGQSAANRLAELEASAGWQSPRARFVGSAAELSELLAALLTVATGVRLHPAVLDIDLEELAQLVLPELRRRGLLAPVTPDATFRDLLGLPRPVSRYTAPGNAVVGSAGVRTAAATTGNRRREHD
jgi:alkanesulfonate monooxygenase SsuD/methylene tetrahydromethanopterin reductase-like flavin-dependent oxidoreductase (luciferase family)